MSKINDGGPAFPTLHIPYASPPDWSGMPLRDYFAAKAFPAVFANAMKEAKEGSGLLQYDDWPVGIALDAYRVADAMLMAREGGDTYTSLHQRDELLAFAEEVRRSGDTRLASMAISVIAKVKGGSA